jgi:adenylate kinase family enzyme
VPTQLGKRIAVYGPSGSGKSTLARDLGAALGLPVVELDAIFHAQAGWVDLSPEEFRARVSAVLTEHADGWVIEGNYAMVRDLVLARADTVVWLRLPFRTVYPRLAWRTLTRAKSGAELWNGNRETWRQTLLTRDSMLLWGITAWRRATRHTREALATIPHQATVIELRTARQVAALTAHARTLRATSH